MADPVSTTCMRCAVGCGHVHQGADLGNGLDLVRGDAAHPVNRGLACGRGIRETADPEGEWLTRPLVRKDGELVRATWEDALDRVADAITTAMAGDPDDVAVLGSGQQTNEAAYALGKLARGGIGTRNYDANTTLCMASAVKAYYDAFGSDAPPPTYDDIPEAQTHVVWGANPAVAHPVMFRWIADAARDDDSRLVVVDPVRSETAEAADHHIQPKPGGDFALARALLAHLVENGGVDDEFVHANTDGFAALTRSLPSVAAAADEAGVDVETVEFLADVFDNPTLVYWGMGVNQSVRGTATSRALVDCCLASGNMGPGSGPFSLTGQANSMGTRVCSSKGSWPGHRDFESPKHRRRVARAWGASIERLPDDAGPGPVGIVEDAPSVIWTVATNPLAGLPDAETAREVFDDAFLVVQDAFRTETAELADVILPAATWGESAGTVMNMERTVSRVRPATGTPAGVKQDLDIIAGVGVRVAPNLFDEPALDPAVVFDEFAVLTAGTDADCSGLSYERLDEELAVRWPAPDPQTSGGYRYYDTETDTWAFPTPSGRAQFSSYRSEGIDGLPEQTSDDYPLTLTTAREADGYNTGVRSRDVDDPGPVTARVNPETVTTYSDAITESQTVLRSPRGRVPAVIEADEGIPAGMVWVPIHHPMTNQLTIAAVDPESDEPNYKQCAVRLVSPESEAETTVPVSGSDPSEDATQVPPSEALAPEVGR